MRTVLAFLFAGVLVGLLSVGAGLLIGHADPDEAGAVQCAVFSLELQPQGSSQIQLTAPVDQAVLVEMNFLNFEGHIVRPRRVQLQRGATMMVGMPLEQSVSAVQVEASAPIQVEATFLRDGSTGPLERQVVSCKTT